MPQERAPVRRQVVVDGSNLATEGRTMPSLAQLDEAVRAWIAENPDDEVIVVVDASFEYRIEEWERGVFEEAEMAGEVLSPPAGAIGRGDGFLLRIAHRTDATVLSNDSFQEFHGQYEWLFDEGRLVGGKPVPGVGWIFTPRVPVRGPKSRVAVRDAKKAKQTRPAKRQQRLQIVQEPVAEAIAQATVEAMSPGPSPTGRRGGGRRRGGRSPEGTRPPDAVNDPLPFITFIADHRLGTEVDGVVESFTSHGAFVTADGARCYVPVVGLGDPAPRSAKQVLKRGETRVFVVQALDAPRRGIELALPGFSRVSGAPTEETLKAEIGVTSSGKTSATKRVPGSKAAVKKSAVARAPAKKTPAKKAPAKKAAAKKTATKKVAAKKVSAKKVAAKKVAAKKNPAKKAPAKKAPAKKAAAKKVAVRSGPSTTRVSAKAAVTAAKASLARKRPAAASAAGKKAPAKKAAPRTVRR